MNTAADWNKAIASLPNPHLLQTWEWAQCKQPYGWQSIPVQWENAAAMVLQRSATPFHLKILYAPRGPLLDWQNTDLRHRVLADLEALTRRQKAIFIKIDPEILLGTGIPGTTDAQENPTGKEITEELTQRGWRFSPEQIQFRNTALLDLTGSEEQWLARMKQKTRYNIRLAEKKGVTVRQGTANDLPLLYQMYAETSVRDGFVIRPREYYFAIWETFMQQEMAFPLIAEVENEPVAALILFCFAGRAWYLYGMSRNLHRETMPNYLLQFAAMRFARARGCDQYDLWGAPDVFDESDSMWGVFRFKDGLGCTVLRTIGAWDYPARPLLYTLYTRILPRLLDIMRRRGKARTRQEVSL
jgi:peptidoglycan pentaglycine glycine transferase (the first glycine)